MLRTFKLLLLFFSVSSLFTTCKKENLCDCIKRTGAIGIDTRNLKGFDKIYIEDNVNVFITQDSAFEVKVEAGEHISPLIKTEVSNNTLTIKNKNRCNWTRSYDKPLNVYIKMPIIKYITSNGTGNIKGTNTITCDNFDIEIANSGNADFTINNHKLITHVFGSGDLTLHGKTHDHLCNIGGTSFLYCADFKTNYTWIHSFTSGICQVNATDLLTCFIDRMGDVYCGGHPSTVEKELKGDGKLFLQ